MVGPWHEGLRPHGRGQGLGNESPTRMPQAEMPVKDEGHLEWVVEEGAGECMFQTQELPLAFFLLQLSARNQISPVASASRGG